MAHTVPVPVPPPPRQVITQHGKNGTGESTGRAPFQIVSERAKHTLPETNMTPENRPSEKETSILTIHFQELC